MTARADGRARARQHRRRDGRGGAVARHADGAVGAAADGRPARREPRARDGCTRRTPTASRSRRRSPRYAAGGELVVVEERRARASRSSTTSSRRSPTRCIACSRRASCRGGRRRHVPDPRRRLAVLPRRDHQAPRPDRHVRASVWAHVRGDESGSPGLDGPRRLARSDRAPRRGGCGGFPRTARPEAERSRGARATTCASTGLAVSQDGNTVFVYASTGMQAEQAAHRRKRAAGGGPTPSRFVTEHWLREDERWDDEPEQPDVEEDLDRAGFAPWEVRVEAGSLREAHDLAEPLGLRATTSPRTFTYVIAGAGSREEAGSSPAGSTARSSRAASWSTRSASEPLCHLRGSRRLADRSIYWFDDTRPGVPRGRLFLQVQRF